MGKIWFWGPKPNRETRRQRNIFLALEMLRDRHRALALADDSDEKLRNDLAEFIKTLSESDLAAIKTKFKIKLTKGSQMTFGMGKFVFEPETPRESKRVSASAKKAAEARKKTTTPPCKHRAHEKLTPEFDGWNS